MSDEELSDEELSDVITHVRFIEEPGRISWMVLQNCEVVDQGSAPQERFANEELPRILHTYTNIAGERDPSRDP